MSSRAAPRWGILGTGRIAHDFVTALQVLPEANIVAVGSRHPESGSKFAREHNIPKSHSSYEDLVSDPGVDIIYVGTPNSSHKEHSLLALSHGKGVVCEKTFTVNATEAEEVIRYARSKGLFLMEANWMPFFPLFKKVKQLIGDGAIGDVTMLQADLGFRNNNELNPGLLNPEIAGGSLLACGIYPVTLASFIFGDKPHKVVAAGNLSESGVDIQASATLTYKRESGDLMQGMAILASSIDTFMPSSAVIMGTKGSIKLHGMFCCPLQATLTSDGGKEQLLQETLIHNEGCFNFPNSAGLAYEAQEVIDCWKEGKIESDIMTLERTLANMRVMDDIRRQIGLKFPSETLK